MTGDEASKKIKGEDGTEVRTSEDLMELRLLIDNYEASVIIGKGGTNVKNVRSESGAFVSILKTDSPVSKERVMTVKGPELAICSALNLIVNLLLDSANQRKQTDPAVPVEADTTYSLKILIHKFLAGSIIGKQGTIIREIQESTKARVQLSNDALPGSTEKTVTITGTPETFLAGATRVVSQLANNPLRTGSSVILYIPGAAVPQSGYAPPFGAPAYGAAPQYGAPPQQQSPYGAPPSPYGAPAAYGSPYGAPPPQAGGPAPGSKTEKIVIPTVCAGTVIGKGGSIIRDIKTQSGTSITIADAEPTAPNDRVVAVTGPPQGIQTAIYLIRQRVESYQPPGGHPAM